MEDMLLTFALLGITILLFTSDRLRLDLVAILLVIALILTGLLTTQEALAGFADPIIMTIAGLFVVSSGLMHTGVANLMGQGLDKLARNSEVGLLILVMLFAAGLSAFMSSTGAVAIFLPVVVSLAWNAHIAPSKLLIPLAYGSLIGGVLTLIGTPPNIVVSNQLAANGYTPFSFFTFTPVGLLMLAIGISFMLVIGRTLLPNNKQRTRGVNPADVSESPSLEELLNNYHLPGNMFRLRMRSNSPLINATLEQAALGTRYRVNVLERQSWPDRLAAPLPARPVEPGSTLEVDDILLVQGAPEDVKALAEAESCGILPLEQESDESLITRELGMAEVLLPPRSHLIGHDLKELSFRDRYNVTVVGIMRMGTPLSGDIATASLRFGDTLLVQGTWQKIALLRQESRDFVVVGQPREMILLQRPIKRAPLAGLIVVGMLLLMAFNIVEAVVAVMVAATAMLLTGCLTMEDAYHAMNWESIVLMAGLLPMATALQKSGGIEFITHALTSSLGQISPVALMAGLFIITSAFSQVISNTATTVLMAPIAFQAAIRLGIAPQTFLMAVAMAASTSFSSPIGSASNTLVLGPGGYRFGDYLRVGIPLQVLMLLSALIALPLLFPF